MIERKTAKVFYAPTRRRRYFDKRGCARGEASAMIERKYPREHTEDQYGTETVCWHWKDDERLHKVYERLWRLLERKL